MTNHTNHTSHIARSLRLPVTLVALAAFASCGGDSVVQPTFGSACSAGGLSSGQTVEGELNDDSCSVPYHYWSGSASAYVSYKVSLQEGKGYWFYLRQIPNDTGLNELDAVLSLFGKDENGASVPLAVSDDDAGGIDGHDSEIYFIAPRSGTFNIVASSYDTDELGGFRLTMRECPVVATLDTAGTYSLPFADSECVRHEMGAGDPSKIVLVAIPASALETIDLSVSGDDFDAVIEFGGPGFDVYDNIYDDVAFVSSATIPATASIGLGDVGGTLTLAVGASIFDPSGNFQVVMDRIVPVSAPIPSGARMTMKSVLAGSAKRR